MTDANRERDTPDATTTTALREQGEVEESETEAGTPITATLDFENDSIYTFANLSVKDNNGNWNGDEADSYSASCENISIPTLLSASYHKATELDEYEHNSTYHNPSDELNLWDSDSESTSDEFDEWDRQARVPKTGVCPIAGRVGRSSMSSLPQCAKCDRRFGGLEIFRQIEYGISIIRLGVVRLFLF